nr:hypothetical protein EP46_03010 [Pantoea sp. 3.5.1]
MSCVEAALLRSLPVQLAIFTQPLQNGGASLYTVALQGLTIRHLAFFNRLDAASLKDKESSR